MALNTGQRTSYADRSSVKDNIADRLDFMTPLDTPMLSYLGFMKDAGGAASGANSLSFPCTQTRHTWLNDDLVPSTSALAAAYSAAGGSITVTTDHGARFDDDDVIMIGLSRYLVTNVSVDTLTISIISDDAAHASGDVVYGLGNARLEGTEASAITARTTDFGSTENFTQIFMGKVDMSGTEQATEYWGINGDPYEYQVNKRLKEQAIQLERSCIYSERSATYPTTNATRRFMGGLSYYIRDDASANVTDANGQDLDEILINDMLQNIWEDGGMPDTIFVNMRQKRMLNSFLEPMVRVDRTETIYGTLVGTFHSDAGDLDVVINRHLKPDDLIILTREFIGIGPLSGNGNDRSFFVEKLPRSGDSDQSMMIGEYTMEVRNNTKAHGWIHDLSTA